MRAETGVEPLSDLPRIWQEARKTVIRKYLEQARAWL